MRLPLPVVALFLAATVLAGGAGCAGRAAPAGPAPGQSVFKVRASLLNLLSCPTDTCSVIEDLHEGQEVAVLSPRQGGWVQVRVLPSGPEGYVLADFLVR